MDDTQEKCPVCGLDASYKYGTTKSGKRRRLCLVCGRQFSIGGRRQGRPNCPVCGRPMHLYMKQEDIIRFRCSDYPSCRTFLKKPRSISNL